MKDRYIELADKIRKSLWEHGALKYPLQGGIDLKIIESTIRANFEVVYAKNAQPDEGIKCHHHHESEHNADIHQYGRCQSCGSETEKLDPDDTMFPDEGMEARASKAMRVSKHYVVPSKWEEYEKKMIEFAVQFAQSELQCSKLAEPIYNWNIINIGEDLPLTNEKLFINWINLEHGTPFFGIDIVYPEHFNWAEYRHNYGRTVFRWSYINVDCIILPDEVVDDISFFQYLQDAGFAKQ